MIRDDLPSLVLGSASPRRKELLASMGFRFRIEKPDIEERRQPGERPENYVARNAQLKTEAVARRITGTHLVICADTIVAIGDKVYEKPDDVGHAVAMLKELSGRTHTVWTGMSVALTGDVPKVVTRLVSTAVTLRPAAEAAIKAYVATGEPLDKAGSYAIQGQGGYMVEKITGSYSNVVGLPLHELVAVLEGDFKLNLWK